MIKHPNYWLEDGSVIIIVENVVYRLYRSLITRLSPRFFNDCCQITEAPANIIAGSDSLSSYTIRPEVQISKDDFEALIAHILHNIPLTDEASLAHVLRLFIVSSAVKGDFQNVHCAAEKQLSAYMLRNPLDIDFADYDLLKKALIVSEGSDNVKLKSLLKRALYYSYTTHDDITFEEGFPPDSAAMTYELDLKPTSIHSSRHITGSDAALCERLMSQLSEHFSPTLFQPPAALHMECTDVYASLWMERAVQPAFADNGTANPFLTLRRLQALDWKREADCASEERSEPCIDCLEHMRREWSGEAQAIWEMMDGWLAD